MRNAQTKSRPSAVDQPRSALASSAPAGELRVAEFPCQSAADVPNGAEIALPTGLPYHMQDTDMQHIFEVERAHSEGQKALFPCYQGDATGPTMAAITAPVDKMACAKVGPFISWAACIASGLNAAVASLTSVT